MVLPRTAHGGSEHPKQPHVYSREPFRKCPALAPAGLRVRFLPASSSCGDEGHLPGSASQAQAPFAAPAAGLWGTGEGEQHTRPVHPHTSASPLGFALIKLRQSKAPGKAGCQETGTAETIPPFPVSQRRHANPGSFSCVYR